MAELVSVHALFETGNDDKEEDTVLSISLSRSGFEIAGLTGVTGYFKTASAAGPFPLVIFSPIQHEELEGCTATIRIDPNAQDRWTFDYALEFVFSDGSVSARWYSGNDLSQDSRMMVRAV